MFNLGHVLRGCREAALVRSRDDSGRMEADAVSEASFCLVIKCARIWGIGLSQTSA